MDDGLKIIIESMQADIREIKQDVKDLAHFKWKIIGIAIGSSTIITILLKGFL